MPGQWFHSRSLQHYCKLPYPPSTSIQGLHHAGLLDQTAFRASKCVVCRKRAHNVSRSRGGDSTFLGSNQYSAEDSCMMHIYIYIYTYTPSVLDQSNCSGHKSFERGKPQSRCRTFIGCPRIYLVQHFLRSSHLNSLQHTHRQPTHQRHRLHRVRQALRSQRLHNEPV